MKLWVPVKQKIAFRLAIWLSAFGIFVALVTAYLSYEDSHARLVQSNVSKLETTTRVMSRRFSLLVDKISQNVRFLSKLPEARDYQEFKSDGQVILNPVEQQRLEDTFKVKLGLHPEFYQLRFISAREYGRELVRVEKGKQGLVVVGPEQREEKGHYPYVFRTLRLSPGHIYLSRIEINQEAYRTNLKNIPTMRVATSVTNQTDEVIGVIVINVDLNSFFELLKTDLPAGVRLVLANQGGDYLIHPDPGKTFGFMAGHRFTIQDDFPGTKAFVADSEQRNLSLIESHQDLNQLWSWLKVPYGQEFSYRYLILGISAPSATMFADTQDLAQVFLRIIVSLSLGAIFMSLFFSRLFSKPLQQMAKSVERFKSSGDLGSLPLSRNDEIGVLARSFKAMHTQIASQMQELEDSRSHLDHIAHHDPLTRLPNRLLFHDRLSHAIKTAARNHSNLAVLFLDLDHFKEINDSLGHNVGDLVLTEVARLFRGHLREGDTIARFGGDEFLVILEEAGDPHYASSVAQKLLQQFQSSFCIGSQELYINVSIGIAMYPQDGADAATLIRNADAAMYRSKEEGRNTFRFYKENMTKAAYQRVLMETELRYALEKEQFFLEYQPQVELDTGLIIGAEVLIRWMHPVKGLIPPAEFISIAEDCGVIVPISHWVMEQACYRMREWKKMPMSLRRLSVNLSGKQLKRPDFLESTLNIFERTGCRPEWLEFEVTEGFLMENPDESISILNSLRGIGVEIAIDDFGTGYSSLSYLKQLPITKLKIDQSFVRDIPEDADDMAITRAVIALSDSLNLKTIAEGVETQVQREFLVVEGCQEAQGYLFSRPVSEQNFVALLGQGESLPKSGSGNVVNMGSKRKPD